jgi:hypothetical protein
MFVRLEKKKISTKNPFCLALDAAAAPLVHDVDFGRPGDLAHRWGAGVVLARGF